MGIWDEVKDQIRNTLPERTFSLWINPLNSLTENQDRLELACPNKFSLNWIAENYRDLIEQKMRDLGYHDLSLGFRVMNQNKMTPPLRPHGVHRQLSLPKLAEGNGYKTRPLNKGFTFDRFVVGRCNEFAYSAAKALALDPSLSYNSLFMLSKTGLGKSHLSQATGHAILRCNPKKRVYYVTAEDFINEMIYSLKNNKIDEFKNKYRRCCDVLLIEEVHFLGGKEKTQLELSHILDALTNKQKRIMFTSPLLPKEIPNLTKELASRFTSGIITTLSDPDYQTRVKILEKKAEEQGLALSEEIITLLAKHLTGDIRQMESALRCLKAKSELLKEKITLDLVKDVTKAHIPIPEETAMGQVLNVVCTYFKVDPLILRSKSRKKIHSYPRNVYIYLCRRHTQNTVEEIGKSVNRSHSTVVYANEAIDKKMKYDRKIKRQVAFLSEKIGGRTK